MRTSFALDLALARRRSGFSQQDVAILLAIDQTRVSELERGVRQPSVRQVCELSLVFGRSFHCLFTEHTDAAKAALATRIARVPKRERPHLAMFNRAYALRRLRQRLDLESPNEYGRA